MSDEQQWCPRRIENGAMPGPKGEPPAFFPNADVWRQRSDHRTCSYCGSWHPEDFISYVEGGGEVGPTDKTYKVYLARSPEKFYFQHLEPEQRSHFIKLLNEKRISIGLPGYFYVMPYFIKAVPA